MRVERALAESEARLQAILEHTQALEQERVQELERDGRFISHASHELRSPLGAVHEFLTLLRDGIGGDLSTEHERYVGIMLRNVCHLRDMIGDLSEVTRARAGKLVVTASRVDVAPYLEDLTPTLTSMADARQLRLEVRRNSGLSAVLGDPDRIRQVLVHLIENAVRYAPEGSRVTVVADPYPGEPDYVRFTVSDQGCGIPAGELECVFEYMHGATHSGTGPHGLGVGLYICRELVTAQKGRIWAERGSGGGTTVRFSLPVFSPSDGEGLSPRRGDARRMLMENDVAAHS